MIKSLGIYGDSFGTYSLAGTPLSRQYGLRHHWSSLLSKELNCTIKNYALSGSSVYYSYKKFLETSSKNDLCIFLVTEPGRYIKPLDFSSTKNACVTNQAQIDVWKKTKFNSTDTDIQLLDKLSNWFELSDSEHQYDMSELMIDKVMTVHDNVIIIPCYEVSLRESYRKTKNMLAEVNLCSLYYRQMDELMLTDDGMNIKWVENSEYISGHLTPEYNYIAYENISFYLKNKYWNWKVPIDPIIHVNNREKYYEKKN